MTIGILKEPAGETRISLLPEQVQALVKKNVAVLLETNAGDYAFANDDSYINAGAVIASRQQVLQQSDVVLSIQLLTSEDVDLLQPNKVALGIFQPLYNVAAIQQLATRGITTFSMDMIPRTTRAQSMDVLSSQANISGYRAVLLAANTFPKYFPMFMTAAGTIPPAKVLILGAGVAGLQAIATAKRLGAVVEVFDTRPAVKEEVMSLGAKFVEVEGAADASTAGGYAVEQNEEYKLKQQQRIAEAIAKADIVITTAQIPGMKAPILITEPMLASMKPGSVIIDIAAATGGNTPFTKNNETVIYKGAIIICNSNLPAGMPSDASKLYGKNIMNFFNMMIDKDGQWNLNWDDDLVKGTCITFNGNIVNDRVKELLID